VEPFLTLYVPHAQWAFALMFQLPAIGLGLVMHQCTRRAPRIYALLFLPGTMVHECLHWLMAFLLGGQPTRLSLWPHQKPDGSWALGTVSVTNLTWYNGIFICLAPLLAPAALLSLAPGQPGWSPSMHDLWYWLIAAPIWISCFPSAQDWSVALRSLVPLLLMGLVCGISWWAWSDFAEPFVLPDFSSWLTYTKAILIALWIAASNFRL